VARGPGRPIEHQEPGAVAWLGRPLGDQLTRQLVIEGGRAHGIRYCSPSTESTPFVTTHECPSLTRSKVTCPVRQLPWTSKLIRALPPLPDSEPGPVTPSPKPITAPSWNRAISASSAPRRYDTAAWKAG